MEYCFQLSPVCQSIHISLMLGPLRTMRKMTKVRAHRKMRKNFRGMYTRRWDCVCVRVSGYTFISIKNNTPEAKKALVSCSAASCQWICDSILPFARRCFTPSHPVIPIYTGGNKPTLYSERCKYRVMLSIVKQAFFFVSPRRALSIFAFFQWLMPLAALFRGFVGILHLFRYIHIVPVCPYRDAFHSVFASGRVCVWFWK